MRRRAILAAVLLSMIAAAPAAAAPSLVPVGTFDQPVHVAAPPGDTRLFVVEKPGRVVQVGGAPFLDITTLVEDTGERGLLSIAFAPDYATSGLFYLFYTANDGALTVREGTRSASDPNRGELGRILFTVEHSSATNHNGGQLAFGPDGALYVSTGDGATTPMNAQLPGSLLGKILRIEPRVQSAPTVWALGLRNPWRFSFDRQTGDMLIGDVGADAREEVDFAPAGAANRNYGWPACEGNPPGGCPLAGAVPAALSLDQPEYTGVIGGFVVRDAGLPTLLGRYVFGDLSKTTVMSAVVNAGGGGDLRAETGLPVTAASSFGEDGCGHVYVASLNGPVYRIQDGPASPCPATGSIPPPGGQPSDTVGCAISARPARRVQRIVRRGKRLRIRLRATEACTATVRAKRFRTKRNVALRADLTRVVRVKPTKKGLRRMRRALARSERGRLRITVRISARDAAGNATAARLRPRVR
jgi:Glucose / Sorbosone dehydrogenase